ncbi:MAG TPA: hypothetical protein VK453_05725 [Micromonosporaceae bacterium]|nr:hypothetical protein [Micromonosporaceae bacterium]
MVTAAALATSGMVGVAGAEPQAEEPPPSIVEDYRYPGAAAIEARENVKLISGDGHILIADCATPPVNGIGVVRVYSTEATVGTLGTGEVCFRITGTPGRLDLEVPAVFEITGDGTPGRKGSGHNLTVVVRTEAGELPPVTVNPSGSTQVGRGNNAEPTMLLQMRVTP